jgi:hypothetical protein
VGGAGKGYFNAIGRPNYVRKELQYHPGLGLEKLAGESAEAPESCVTNCKKKAYLLTGPDVSDRSEKGCQAKVYCAEFCNLLGRHQFLS